MTDAITLTAPASPASTWFKAVQPAYQTAHNFAMEFDVERTLSDPAWAVVLGYTDSSNYYIMGVGSDRLPFVTRTFAGTTSTIFKSPETAPLEGHISISFRERRFREDKSDVWHCFSLWINGWHVMTHLESVGGLLESPMMGFAAWTGSTVIYNNLHIPQMTNFVDWISLDPGEAPLRALERAIEGQYVKYFIRYNGEVRAWIPRQTDSEHTYTATFDRSQSVDLKDLKTHVRQLGAYEQAEYVRADLVRKYGHRFTELSNPFLITEQECLIQAELAIKRMEEEADIESFTAIYNPVLEIEDHITTPIGERIIDSKAVSFRLPEVKEKVTTRKYTHGS